MHLIVFFSSANDGGFRKTNFEKGTKGTMDESIEETNPLDYPNAEVRKVLSKWKNNRLKNIPNKFIFFVYSLTNYFY